MKKLLSFITIVAVIGVMAINFSFNNQGKEKKNQINVTTDFIAAQALCAFEDGWTTTWDYVVQYYCRLSGPEGSLVILDCRPNS